MELNADTILRKESFGGIEANTDTGAVELLNHNQFEERRRSGDPQLRLVDLETEDRPLPAQCISSPLFLYLEVTKRCNGYCTHCFMNAGSQPANRQEITFADIEGLIGEFADCGGYYIRLTGGEPTIRPDFFDIVACAEKNGIRLGLNTNGLFGMSTLEQIFDTRIRDIRISLDGPESVNDRIRGEGSFRTIYKNLEAIYKANQTLKTPVDLTINSVLMKSTMHHVPQTIKLAAGLGAKLSIGLLRPGGRADLSQMLSPRVVMSTVSKVHRLRTTPGLGLGHIRINFDVLNPVPLGQGFHPFPFDFSRCPMATLGLAVDAYGQIFPCGYMVNLKDWQGPGVQNADMLSMWHESQVLIRARNSTRKGCRGCRYYKKRCNGGCPVTALICRGSMNERDPYCIRDIKQKHH